MQDIDRLREIDDARKIDQLFDGDRSESEEDLNVDHFIDDCRAEMKRTSTGYIMSEWLDHDLDAVTAFMSDFARDELHNAIREAAAQRKANFLVRESQS